ncbi:hypothetical protein [Vibrio rarus]|uniref:hypothetical protein n=1 Tax=Vibrio rarus TaxID=413403 RepID=UPI0021C35DEA|nr:hypothetical protein [Vibrio rarus]
MCHLEYSLQECLKQYSHELHNVFEVEHGMTLNHRLWGDGLVIDIKVRSYGGWYLNVKFRNHNKLILSDTLTGYFIKGMSVKREYADIYLSDVHNEDSIPDNTEITLANDLTTNVN